MKRRRSTDQQFSIKPNMRFSELTQLPISVPVGGFQATILYWGFFDPGYWRNYVHTHSFYEMHYVYQGSGTYQINGQTSA